MNETTKKSDQDFEVISTYTRAQALDDGVLVDLTAWAKDGGPEGMLGGFLIPVACTAAVWGELEDIPDCLQGAASVRGRAHDLLWMLRCAIARKGARGESSIKFEVIMPVRGSCANERDAANTEKQTREYKCTCGPNDDMRPCLTIMLLEED